MINFYFTNYSKMLKLVKRFFGRTSDLNNYETLNDIYDMPFIPHVYYNGSERGLLVNGKIVLNTGKAVYSITHFLETLEINVTHENVNKISFGSEDFVVNYNDIRNMIPTYICGENRLSWIYKYLRNKHQK